MAVMMNTTASTPPHAPTTPRASTCILLDSSVTQKRPILLALIHVLCLMLSTVNGIPPCSSSPTVNDDVIVIHPLLPPLFYRTRSSLFGVSVTTVNTNRSSHPSKTPPPQFPFLPAMSPKSVWEAAPASLSPTSPKALKEYDYKVTVVN
jgi:hypothetical protein